MMMVAAEEAFEAQMGEQITRRKPLLAGTR